MKLKDILLTESVAVHGIGLFAYTVVVAEAFDALPDYDETAVKHWTALINSNDTMSKRVLYGIKLDYTDTLGAAGFEDTAFGDMVEDIKKNKHLTVYTKAAPHPGMTPEQNLKLRAVHDVLAHTAGNSKAYARHLLKKTNRFIYRCLQSYQRRLQHQRGVGSIRGPHPDCSARSHPCIVH